VTQTVSQHAESSQARPPARLRLPLGGAQRASDQQQPRCSGPRPRSGPPPRLRRHPTLLAAQARGSSGIAALQRAGLQSLARRRCYAQALERGHTARQASQPCSASASRASPGADATPRRPGTAARSAGSAPDPSDFREPPLLLRGTNSHAAGLSSCPDADLASASSAAALSGGGGPPAPATRGRARVRASCSSSAPRGSRAGVHARSRCPAAPSFGAPRSAHASSPITLVCRSLGKQERP
jgi:hypothetical protein